jgi:glutamyl-tRNA synthetase
MTEVVVRFAPSPTGNLHIGSARTALINWLYARKHKGKMLLRIEDTDNSRSTKEYVENIKESLNWLGIDYDGDITYQTNNYAKHINVANELVNCGKAYYCTCSIARLAQLRETQLKSEIPPHYDGYCRDLNLPQTENAVIRLRISRDEIINLEDMIKGLVTINSNNLDDMVLVRADGTPTYLLACVVDDINMGITHIIRGDDHLTNAFRQICIYNACGKTPPKMGHMPLIHGSDNKKLSKRHSATSVLDYKALGYLPNSLLLYLYSLGFHYKSTMTLETIINNFNVSKMSKSPSCFDINILNTVNKSVIKTTTPECLINMTYNMLPDHFINDDNKQIIGRCINACITRSNTLADIVDILKTYYLCFDEKNIIPEISNETKLHVLAMMETVDFSTEKTVESSIRNYIKTHNLNNKEYLNSLRWLLTRQESSPNLSNIIWSIGYNLCLDRINISCSC